MSVKWLSPADKKAEYSAQEYADLKEEMFERYLVVLQQKFAAAVEDIRTYHPETNRYTEPSAFEALTRTAQDLNLVSERITNLEFPDDVMDATVMVVMGTLDIIRAYSFRVKPLLDGLNPEESTDEPKSYNPGQGADPRGKGESQSSLHPKSNPSNLQEGLPPTEDVAPVLRGRVQKGKRRA